MMTEEQCKKFIFVSCALSALMRQIDPNILSLTYIRSETTNGTEVVNINYSSGYTKSVDVTADSLLAIAKDVLNHI